MPSVVELCDLSHYDDTFTKSCSLRSIPTYANTMSVATNEGHSHRLSSSDCSLGHAKPIDQQSPNTFKADVHTDSGESCQDATGPRHTIVKQASTSSIQVSEGTVIVAKL